MDYQAAIQKLLQLKAIIDGLKAIDTSLLTETEREAIGESLDQTYDRVAYFLAVVRTFEGEGKRKEVAKLPPSLLLPQTPSSSLTTHRCLKKGTAKPILESPFFCLFILARSLPYDTPIARHPNQFFREPLPLKNWPRTHLAMWPPSHGNAFSCQ